MSSQAGTETGSAERERLLELINGFRATQVTYVVAKLRVADLLAGGARTAAELAREAGVTAEALERVLRLAAFYGLLSEEPEDRFALTALGEQLRSDHAGSLRASAVMLGQEHYRAWGDLLHAVTTGEPAFEHVYGKHHFEYLAANPQSQADFDAAMAGNVTLQVSALPTSFDFSAAAVVVDVGGGNGAVLASILNAAPGVRGILYEQPHLLPRADQFLQSRGVRDRCELVGGDFFDSVPEGGDVYVLSHIVHDWNDEAALRILGNCRAAMKPDAVLLLLEAVVPPHGTRSVASVFDVNMLVMLGGRERTEDEFRTLLDRAGFRLDRIAPLSERRSLVEARPV